MSKARIMIVEDEGIIAEDVQASLEDMGYEVAAVAITGEDAVERAEKERPDLILMDVLLQGAIDGIEAAARIRKTLDIPIIYLTAYADDMVLERAKTTEPFAYMIKPIRERELYTNIEMALFKHEMDKKLKQGRQWFFVTLKSIGDAVIAADREGCVTFLNPVAETLTGWSHEEARGKPLVDVFNVVNEKTGAQLEDLADQLIRDGKAPGLLTRSNLLIATNGARIAIGAAGAPIKDDSGSTIGIVIVFRDITERKKVEERLRLLSESVQQSTEGVAVVDLEGNLLFLNQAFAEMHGYTPDELTAKHLSVFHNPEQMPSVEAANRVVREYGQFSGEIWHSRRDGSIFPGLTHNSLLRDGDGKPVGIIATLRDITGLKESEEALRRSHEKLEAYSSQLEAKVRERTMDLENSRKELKKYSESLEKTNEALKLIIEGIEEQKREVERKISHNLNLTVKPVLDQLKSEDLPDTTKFLLKSLEFNLANVFSSFGVRLIKEGHRLTPREVRICEMVRSGLSSKQMAKVMGVSPQTILVHRKNIRKKLGLARAKQNLASYLKANL